MTSLLASPILSPTILILEMVLIWWHCALDGFDKPQSLVSSITSKGYTLLVFDVIGTIVTVDAALLLALLLTISTGRFFLIPEPTVESKLATYFSFY